MRIIEGEVLRGPAPGFNGFMLDDLLFDGGVLLRSQIESHVVVAATEFDGGGLALQVHEGKIEVGLGVFGIELDGFLHFGFGPRDPSKVAKNDGEVAMDARVVRICVEGARESGEGEIGVAEAAVNQAERDPGLGEGWFSLDGGFEVVAGLFELADLEFDGSEVG